MLSTVGCQSPETLQVLERLVSTCSRTRQIIILRNGTGPGVRKSKRPLLVCQTCSMKTSEFGINIKPDNSIPFGNKVTGYFIVTSTPASLKDYTCSQLIILIRYN